MTRDAWLFLAVVVALFVLIFGAVFAIDYAVDQYRCTATAEAMETTSYYSRTTGCMVRVNGKLVPLKNVRAM